MFEEGEIISIRSYFSIVKGNGIGETVLKDLRDNSEYIISSLPKEVHSAEQYSSQIEVGLSDVIKILLDSSGKPFTLQIGKEKIRGQLLRNLSEFGKSIVKNLDNKLPIEIDHRAIKSLIINGVKYVI